METKRQGLAPLPTFARRVARSLLWALGVILAALAVGVAGYHWIAKLSWIDALHEASMILSGMGPVNQLDSHGAKIFASAYALLCGLVFLVVMGIVLAPILHRVMHRLHMDEDERAS
jgi:hypothetical protein